MNEPPLLKICGLRDAIQAAAVARLGADAVGVIGVRRSPRWLEVSARPELCAAVAEARPECLRVLVVADPDDADLVVLEGGTRGFDVLQLHGSESVARCLQLRRQLPASLRIWKALRLRAPADLAAAEQYGAVVDALLLDAWVEGQLGGTGQALPLEWLRTFRPEQPWWLAGGITPERLERGLDGLRPDGLDASSGVEVAPGVKNLDRVERLVRAVQQLRQRRRSEAHGRL